MSAARPKKYIEIGDAVHIVGAGPAGLLLSQALVKKAKQLGCSLQVHLIDQHLGDFKRFNPISGNIFPELENKTGIPLKKFISDDQAIRDLEIGLFLHVIQQKSIQLHKDRLIGIQKNALLLKEKGKMACTTVFDCTGARRKVVNLINHGRKKELMQIKKDSNKPPKKYLSTRINTSYEDATYLFSISPDLKFVK